MRIHQSYQSTILPLTLLSFSCRALRGLSGTYNVRANERDRGTSRNIECLVQFLNNTQQNFIIDRRSKGQDLLDSVFKYLDLIETDFFGLKYLPHESHRHQTNNITPVTKNNIQLLNKTQYSNSYDHSPSSNASLSSSSAATTNNNHDNHNLSVDSTTTSNTTNVNYNNTNHSNNINNNTTISSSSNDSNNIQNNTTIVNGNNDLQQASPRTNDDDNNISTFIEERWLDPTKSIRKQYKSGPPYKFYFRVKFYVSDPCKLADDTTRNHLYLQLRQDILNKRLIVPTCSAILLASYILQSEVGDYKRELQEENYAANFRLLPNQNDDIKKKVIELHKQHKSLSSADAEYQFLEHAAKKLDCYGVEFYNAKDLCQTDVQLGVSSNGIVVFKNNERMNQFPWAKIIKIMFKKKIFSIQLRRDEGDICDNFIKFDLLTNQACKSFWEECVAQHSFFGLHQPKSPPKKFFSFLNFGSKFQYNGKTEYQTMEESRKRSFSHFSRTPSKRYARRTLPIGRPSWSELSSQDNKKSVTPPESQSFHESDEIDNCDKTSVIKHTNQLQTLSDSIKAIKKSLDGERKDLIEEFEKLSRKKEDESLDESKLMENINKNRYRDILPYDSTRVQLNDSMTGDYINASFVDMTVPSGTVNRYIATQGPLASTCDDFWQMVWEQNSSLIIMVTPLVEAGRVKCHKYWPDEKEETRYGQLLVRNLSEKSKTATIDRTIQLLDVKVS